MNPRNTTDDQIIVAIKEIMVTIPDVSFAQVTITHNEVNKVYVTKKRVRNVRQRFRLWTEDRDACTMPFFYPKKRVFFPKGVCVALFY